MKFALVLLLVLVCSISPVVAAPGVAVNMTCDNLFGLYFSTDDSVLGTLMLSGDNWPSTYSGAFDLTSGVVNYLHVVAANQGGPAALIGDFILTDGSFLFANGTSSMVTSTTDWLVSDSGFGQDYYTPVFMGDNGASTWGFRTGISADADWIWGNAQTEYFSAQVLPTVVPEPGSLLPLGAGLASIIPLLRRRKA